MKSGLYIVASPIGNLDDISARAIQVLNGADVVACEDTRVTKKLFSLLGISCKKIFITYHNYNEEEQSQLLLDYLNQDKSVALISDAGSPLISDPGYKIVRKCKELGIYVTSIPGCCAIITALQISGLPTNQFMFAGFVPNKEKARIDFFDKLKHIPATIVVYETAQRLLKTLNVIKNLFEDREISIARELTKIYEECINGTADDLIAHYSERTPKGEIVMMIAPCSEDNNKDDVNLEDIIREKLSTAPLKSVVKEIVATYGFNKNEVYDLALRIKDEQ